MISNSSEDSLDEIIKCVVSSNLKRLEELVPNEPPIVPQFPVCGKWRKNITLLHLASSYGSLTCIEFCLPKININAQTEDGWTPLHCAATNRHQSAVELLLKNRANPNIYNSDKIFFIINLVPLHLASINGSSEVILSLLNAGVDANATSNIGFNAIHYAAKTSLSSVIDPLIIAGADFDLASILSNKIYKVSHNLIFSWWYFYNFIYQTPLHIAAECGSTEFAAALISFGADLDAQDKNGDSPLHLAMANCKYTTAKVLLKNGADPTIRNHGGQTPEYTGPQSNANQARAFFRNWEDWDEVNESLEFREKDI